MMYEIMMWEYSDGSLKIPDIILWDGTIYSVFGRLFFAEGKNRDDYHNILRKDLSFEYIEGTLCMK